MNFNDDVKLQISAAKSVVLFPSISVSWCLWCYGKLGPTPNYILNKTTVNLDVMYLCGGIYKSSVGRIYYIHAADFSIVVVMN